MKSNIIRISPFLVIIFLVLTYGCAKLGPKTLKSERSNYNLAVQRTNDEEL